MASFERKVTQFVNSASKQDIIEDDTAKRLIAFLKSDAYNHQGWFSLSRSIGSLGAFCACLGIILIIATNWHMLSDIAKVGGFITLLGGSHFAGIYFSDKGYERTSSALHFLGAGFRILFRTFTTHSFSRSFQLLNEF